VQLTVRQFPGENRQRRNHLARCQPPRLRSNGIFPSSRRDPDSASPRVDASCAVICATRDEAAVKRLAAFKAAEPLRFAALGGPPFAAILLSKSRPVKLAIPPHSAARPRIPAPKILSLLLPNVEITFHLKARLQMIRWILLLDFSVPVF
jgi:hypothetical protein